MEYIGNINNLPKKPGKLASAFSSITGYPVYAQKPIIFLCTAIQQPGIEFFLKKKAQYHLE